MSNSERHNIGPDDTVSPFLQHYTEFRDAGYDRADIIIFFSKPFSDPVYNKTGYLAGLSDNIDREKSIQDQYEFLSSKNNLQKDALRISRNVTRIFLPLLEFDSDNESPDYSPNRNAQTYLKSLQKATKQLAFLLQSDNWSFIDFLEYSYVYTRCFYEVAQKVVFSPANYNLNNPAFRRSAFLRYLIRYSAEELPDRKTSSYAVNPIYRFSYLDPFAMDVFLRTIESAELLKGSLPFVEKQSLLDLLRIDLFLSSVQSAFSRYTYLNGTTYRLQLNRHTSKLLAIPYDQISSVEEIKPIRLFEKIAAHVRNRPELTQYSDHAVLDIRVCILGHSERSVAGNDTCEAGIEDLVGLVLKWYHRITIGDKKPRLNFQLTNIVNDKDYSGAWGRSELTDGYMQLGADQASYQIKRVDYYNKYAFSSAELINHINENDVVFILDCPWLTAENYELKKDGSLSAFSQVLARTQYSLDVDAEQFFQQFSSSFKNSLMRRVDGQFGRILGSNTGTAGHVIRILKEPVLSRIGERLSFNPSQETKKTVYLFTSEKDGVDLASIATDPLTRTEKYDGKNFTIIKYSNRQSEPLRLSDSESVEFRIHLWSIIKYISASFAYLDLRESLLKVLNIEKTALRNQVDVIGIYRSIFVCCSVDKSFRFVNCSIRLSDGFQDCLPLGYKSQNTQREILVWARSLIEPLYRNVVFSNTWQSLNAYGDDAIKTAFLMNLYSSANDVDTMLFWHKYRIQHKTDDYGSIKCTFKMENDIEPIRIRDEEFLGKDFFRDKKLYDIFLDRLERGPIFSFAMEELFSKADRLIAPQDKDIQNSSASIRVLHNIINACERHGLSESIIYANAKKLLEMLNNGDNGSNKAIVF